MAINIARRKFIVALGGGAVWPLAARAQQPNRIRMIGVLMGFAEDDPTAQCRCVPGCAPEARLDGRQQRAHRTSLGRV